MLATATAPARAQVPIRSVVLEKRDGNTRFVLESRSEIRFTLFIRRFPNRLVLTLEDVANPEFLRDALVDIGADYPLVKRVSVQPSLPGSRAVQVEFELRSEALPAIRSQKPEGNRGYRVVMDIKASPVQTPAPPPAPEQAAPAPAAPPAAPAPVAPAPVAPAPVAPAPVAPAPGIASSRTTTSALEDEIVVEVRLADILLSDAITGYREANRVFLPLGELAGILTMAIRTQPAQGTAEGFILSEERKFRLNVPEARLVIGEEAQTFDRALVRVGPDDIYVESQLLSRWLPVDFHLDQSRLQLRVHPRETLPVQSRLERERSASRLRPGSRGYEDPGYPRVDTPYRLFGMPFVDQTLGFGLRSGNGHRQTQARYTAFVTGDLLGLESSLFVNRGSDQESTDVRYTLGRHDIDGRLLGPLRARTVLFGSGIGMPSVPHVALSAPVGSGHGLTLSNRPLFQPTSFDRHTLEGDLPPGWDVELYYNDALAGFQRSRPDGRYRFEDLPLTYGTNEFRLVFHGPLGQRRVERQAFVLEQSGIPAGTLQYNLTAHQDGNGALRSVGQFDWGVSKNAVATAGWVRLPASAEPNALDATVYRKLGLRVFWRNVIGSTELVHSPDGGWLSDTVLKTRIGRMAVDYNHLHLNDFVSEVFPADGNPLRMRDKIRLQTSVSTGGLNLPIALEAQRDQLASGATHLLAGGRVSTYVRNTSISNELTWQDLAGTTAARGALSVSHRVGDIGLSGQLGYSLHPDRRLDTIAVTGEKRIGDGYLLNVGVARAFASSETLYSASLTKSQGAYGLGLNAGWSRASGFALGVQLFIAMGREPREGRWHFDALPKANTGAASMRVFLDDNGNGVLDPGEEPLANAGFTLNGSRVPVRTNAAGVAWLDRLPPHVPLDLAVDVQTLEDPYWQPQRKGVQLVARPGTAATVDFPVALTSEIDGTVYLQDGSSRRGVGNVTLELADSSGKVASTIKTSADGYFVMSGVTPGQYTLRVSLAQLDELGLADPGPKTLTISRDGAFVNGADFVLRKRD